MLQTIIENKYGEQLDFTRNRYYDLLRVTGLTPADATINTSSLATMDGAVFNSSRLNARNIVLTIAPKNTIEKNRVALYKFVIPKSYVKLYFKTATRDVWIDGYVEKTEGDLFDNFQKLQVSIICPNPYFKSVKNESVQFANIEDLFSFPWTPAAAGSAVSSISKFTETNVFNSSDDETGVLIELYATNTVLEPTIYNQTTNEHFTIEHEMQAGDRILLNTRQGEKSLRLISEGVETNIINEMVQGSNWFKLREGDNVFSFTCVHGAEALQLTVTIEPLFVGV